MEKFNQNAGILQWDRPVCYCLGVLYGVYCKIFIRGGKDVCKTVSTYNGSAQSHMKEIIKALWNF